MKKLMLAVLCVAVTLGVVAVGLVSDAGAQQSWVTEARTGKAAPSPEAVCSKLKDLYKIEKASWSLKGRTTGVAVAKDLLGIFQIPPSLRANFELCGSEPKFLIHFDEGTSIMDVLVEVLDGVGAKPQDIGATPVGLRQTLLTDIKKWLAYNSELVKRCQAGSADACGGLHSVVTRATQGWNYSAQELGLGQEHLVKFRN